MCQDAENDVVVGNGNTEKTQQTQGERQQNELSVHIPEYTVPDCVSVTSVDTAVTTRQLKWEMLKDIYQPQCGWFCPTSVTQFPIATEVEDFYEGSDYYFSIMAPQMGELDVNVGKHSDQEDQQNVSFLDQHDGHTAEVKNSIDLTRTVMDMKDASLENFFSRPIKIHEVSWEQGVDLEINFDPWARYFDNKRVVNRIANYYLLRANLRIKFIINGCGFHYGRVIASYLPRNGEDLLSFGGSFLDEDVVQASQLPHVFLDPTTSQGGEILAPFFSPENNIDITRDGWDRMGQIFMKSINLLKHANAATDNVTISVFAWAEDVVYSGLTSREPIAMVAQMGEVDEANAKGYVSGPATALADVAGVLKNIPQIAPYATATEAAMRQTAGFAKQHGFSRPAVTRAPDPIKAQACSSLANTTVPDSVSKLSLDDKQELSIDPRIAGLDGDDPLNIRALAQKESYLTTFTWGTTATTESMLWNAAVSPVQWAKSANAFHFPACAFASLPFRYWTGSMKFRFQVVASAYHKGRLKVVFDPSNIVSNEYNINYTQIVDIADEMDFTIEIGNAQNDTLVEHHTPGVDATTSVHDIVPLPNGKGNGVVGVYVVNELTSPNSTVNNDVEINVFISAGEDFAVYVPDNAFQHFVFKPQMGELSGPVGSNTSEPSAPSQSKTYRLGVGNTSHPDIPKVYTGENIESFRSVLKRYNLHSTLMYSQDSSSRMFYGTRSSFPYLRGSVGTSAHLTSAAVGYNYCNTVLLHWVTGAFQGWRGSIRWKLLPRGEINPAMLPSIYIERGKIGEDIYDSGSINAVAHTSVSSLASSVVIEDDFDRPHRHRPPTGVMGNTYTTGHVNPTTEFEIPYYSNFRFAPGKMRDLIGGLAVQEPWHYRIYGRFNKDTSFDAWVSTGEDFQTYFFTGIPKMFYEAAPPAPSVV